MKNFKVEDLIKIYTIKILINIRRNLCTFLLHKLDFNVFWAPTPGSYHHPPRDQQTEFSHANDPRSLNVYVYFIYRDNCRNLIYSK